MIDLIKGNEFTDDRGALRFFNDFNMGQVVRFYEIAPVNTKIIRAWQAHRYEKKWFHCLAGSFVINLVKVDNFDGPSSALIPHKLILKSDEPNVLAISNGYATGIKAIEEGSRLQVFSDFSLEASKDDDHRFPLNMWEAEWQ
ncbi:sugar epimerase [Allomuricauda sp. SCSIO 65647]|uniref:sugar epimerase n=1 Tax=Allomuricauda sp. SCSIO 65647 TaxID=2908843 RepID=UPI001F3BF173|nr:sugar epimerase [Muricauda sp. SCSIO 65647]UJH67016.1 sugar epimerase [Muricauda sp. SCSIO 65647]